MSKKPPEEPELDYLRQRLDAEHLRERMALEHEHEVEAAKRKSRKIPIEDRKTIRTILRMSLKMTGLHARAQRNALSLSLTHNRVILPGLPTAFAGFRILHITDLHLDMREEIPDVLIDAVSGVECDICVLTGDYRAKTHGDYRPALEAMARVRPHLGEKVYGVLGNHDTIRMVPALEAMGIRMLMNESDRLERQGEAIYLAGIDDVHQYRAGDLQRACRDVPRDAVSILLSHTPEVYHSVAAHGCNLVLCGHTHGGQICLPGGWPVYPNARAPRDYCAGAWEHEGVFGYTSRGSGVSVVDVRLNCPPEITLHELQPGPMA